jgi:drug/metabolite transporter (DMT)-like permease
MNTRRDIIIGRALATGAALAYGSSTVLIRVGVADLAPPLVGAALAMLSGTLVLAVVGISRPQSSLRQKKRSVTFLLLAGVLAGLGVLSSFLALSMAPVVIVNPLQSINPLFTLLWAHLFLGQLEKITPRLVLGTLIVVIGITLITIGREA